MGGKIYSEMLYQRKQRSSTRLGNRVIMRWRTQNKSHNHFKKPRAFSKVRPRGELTIIPIRRTLTKSRHKLVFRHGLKTITIRVIRMCYPQDMEHLGYNIWNDYDARTSNVSDKERYWIIKSMHVGVELLDQLGWTGDQDVTQWFPTPTINDSG